MTGRDGKDKAQATWRVAVTVPKGNAEAFETLLAASLPAVSVFGEDTDPVRQVEGFGPEEPDRATLAVELAVLARSCGIEEPDLTIDAIPPTDWLAATYEAFPPIRIGRFFNSRGPMTGRRSRRAPLACASTRRRRSGPASMRRRPAV